MTIRTVSHLLLFLRIVRYSAQDNDSCSARLGVVDVDFDLENFLGEEKTLVRDAHCSLTRLFEGLESLRLAIEEAQQRRPGFTTTVVLSLALPVYYHATRFELQPATPHTTLTRLRPRHTTEDLSRRLNIAPAEPR